MSDIDLVKKVRAYAEEAEKNGFEVLTVPLRDLFPLLGRMGAAERERDDYRLAFQQSEKAKQDLFGQKDLLITANLNLGERARKAERERDELRGRLTLVREQRDTELNKNTQLEAEIARRDAAAGEPVAWVCGDEEIRDFKAGREVTIVRDCDDSDLEYLPLYTAAPPAVLPQEGVAKALRDCDWSGVSIGNKAIIQAAIEALGAKQQKVVELYKRKSMEVISGQRYSYVLLEDLLPELDAANVKWEVKK